MNKPYNERIGELVRRGHTIFYTNEGGYVEHEERAVIEAILDIRLAGVVRRCPKRIAGGFGTYRIAHGCWCYHCGSSVLNHRAIDPAAVWLVVGHGTKVYANQGMRPAEVLAVLDDQALVWYEMPQGRKFLRIITKGNNETFQNVTWIGMPKKWKDELDRIKAATNELAAAGGAR